MRVERNPRLIENKSFAIIERLLPDLKLPRSEKEILKRVIHATTELDYAKDLVFGPRAVKAGIAAIKNGRDIICDVSMVEAGINKKSLSQFGAKVICSINDKDVVREAGQLGIAKAIVAMRKSSRLMNGAIIVVGNAPTALFEICDLVKKGRVKPALIIGVPVGFVGAVESKKYLTSINIPHITNRSKRGGSSVAAAITNAMLKLAERRVADKKQSY